MSDTCRFTLLPLGVGMGATAVYEGEPSSAFVLRENDRPILLIDIGLGVTRQCIALCGSVPDVVLITHNHSDHSGDLPVVLAVESAQGRSLQICASLDVMERLRNHRIHELLSTGKPSGAFACWRSIEPGRRVPLVESVDVELRRSAHSETSYACLFSHQDQILLGYSSDSGFDAELYRWLAKAPTVVVDGRARGSKEHASFEEIDLFSKQYPHRKILVSSFGRLEDAPPELPHVKTGELIPLPLD